MSASRKNYRYVNQGEYYITQDDNTVLLTTGMTECIAFTLVDKDNPAKRALTHLDGYTLDSVEIAKKNISALVDAFQKQTNSSKFEVHILGGKRDRRNYKHLEAALKELGITVTKYVDTNEFCDEMNVKSNITNKVLMFTPINIHLTMISSSTGVQFTQFESKHFDKMDEDSLVDGVGLSESAEKELYQKFIKLNDKLIETSSPLNKELRHYTDVESLQKELTNLQLTKKKY